VFARRFKSHREGPPPPRFSAVPFFSGIARGGSDETIVVFSRAAGALLVLFGVLRLGGRNHRLVTSRAALTEPRS
jgi:hypothetical protein